MRTRIGNPVSTSGVFSSSELKMRSRPSLGVREKQREIIRENGPFSEMALCEGVTGAGLEVDLESASPFFQLKGNIGFHFPWSEFCRIRNAARIVYCKTLSQIAGTADITPVGMADAAQDVSVKHNSEICYSSGFRPPSPRLRRTPSSPHIRSGTDGTPSVARLRRAKDGGGGGSRTRVSTRYRTDHYMLILSLKLLIVQSHPRQTRNAFGLSDLKSRPDPVGKGPRPAP